MKRVIAAITVFVFVFTGVGFAADVNFNSGHNNMRLAPPLTLSSMGEDIYQKHSQLALMQVLMFLTEMDMIEKPRRGLDDVSDIEVIKELAIKASRSLDTIEGFEKPGHPYAKGAKIEIFHNSIEQLAPGSHIFSVKVTITESGNPKHYRVIFSTVRTKASENLYPMAICTKSEFDAKKAEIAREAGLDRLPLSGAIKPQQKRNSTSVEKGDSRGDTIGKKLADVNSRTARTEASVVELLKDRKYREIAEVITTYRQIIEDELSMSKRATGDIRQACIIEAESNELELSAICSAIRTTTEGKDFLNSEEYRGIKESTRVFLAEKYGIDKALMIETAPDDAVKPRQKRNSTNLEKYSGKVESPLMQFKQIGQQIWLDGLTWDMIQSGEFENLVKVHGITGVTTNPTLIKAYLSDRQVLEKVARLAEKGKTRDQIYFEVIKELA